MKKESGSLSGVYAIGIAALFLTGFLLLVIFGAQSYRETVSGQSRNGSSRALLSYLSTSVRANDEAGGVALREDPERGLVLVLTDRDGAHALRIYRNGGRLLEDYAVSDAPLNPAQAQEIGETERFEAEEENGLMRLTTDEGTVLIHLRSGGAA